MGCCGQKRALLKSPPAPTAKPAQPSIARQPAGTSTARTDSSVVAPVKARVPGPTPEYAVVLRYLERSPNISAGSRNRQALQFFKPPSRTVRGQARCSFAHAYSFFSPWLNDADSNACPLILLVAQSIGRHFRV